MIDLDIEYRGTNAKVVKGANAFAKVAAEDLANFVKGAHVDFARQFLKQFQKQGRFPKKGFLTLVDGSLGKKDFQVKPFGLIEYKVKLETLKPVLLEVITNLDRRSPDRTGAYKKNHVLFKNNRVVAKGFSNIVSFINSDTSEPSDIYRFVNVSPYARKLERYRVRRETQGRYKGETVSRGRNEKSIRGKTAVIPAGAFVLSSRAVRRKFKELKNNIRFSFIPIDPGTARQLDTSGKDTTGYVFAKARRVGGRGRPYLYPSITITGNSKAISSFNNRGFTEDAGL